MRIGILGQLEVLGDDGAAVHVAGAKLRSLLMALALEAGRVVTASRLIHAVWADDPPTGAANALQALVSRLRRVLGDAAVQSHPSGYRLAVAAEDVDALWFERSVAAARSRGDADPATAANLLRGALDRWRGSALVEVGGEEYFAGPIARLEALRLTATEERIAADLRMGRSPEVVDELTALVAEHPLRERLVGALMRALSEVGRSAEALEVYERTRETLAETLGADPSAELSAIHTAVLRGEWLDGAGRRPLPQSPAAVQGQDSGVPSRTNLRAGVTSFIGRTADVAAVRDLVRENRLVTVLGPGGAGKTRLAAEASWHIQEDMPDGVWMVELAPIGGDAERASDAADLVTAVQSAIGLRDMSIMAPDAAGDAVDRLIAALRTRTIVLILDNCEHVITSAADLADRLLGGCPQLRLLTTSRESLGISGEAVWPLEPLSLPPAPDGRAVADANLVDAEAVRLLVERARAVRPGFALSDGDAAPVARICRALDGMPLAIELAAARLRTMTPAQLADRLDDRFRLLTRGSRTALPRHQTLRGVVDWSWDLLSEAERAVLRRLSVFAGGVPLEAAEQVCADEQVVTDDVLEMLTDLVDKSLLVVADDGATPRYRMLETIKAYCVERLRETGGEDAARRARRGYVLGLAEAAEPHLRGAEQLVWFDRLAAVHDDITAALRDAIAACDAAVAVRIVAAIGWYWVLAGAKSEGLALTIEALALPGPADDEARAVAGASAAYVSMAGVGGFGAGERWLREALRIADSLEQPPALVRYATMFGALVEADQRGSPPGGKGVTLSGPAGRDAHDVIERLLTDEDPWVRAQTRLTRTNVLPPSERAADMEQALVEAREAGDRWCLSYVLLTLANLAARHGEVAVALEHVDEAYGLVTELRDLEDRVLIGGIRAQLLWFTGDRGGYAAALDDVLRDAERIGWADGLAMLAYGRSDLARWDGDTHAARIELEYAEEVLGDIGIDPVFGSMLLDSRAYLDAMAGDLTVAATRRAEALKQSLSSGDPYLVGQVLVGVADQAVVQGQAVYAARILAAVDVVAGGPDLSRPDGARVEGAARAALGDSTFAAEFGRTRAALAEMSVGVPQDVETVHELTVPVLREG